VPLHEIQHPIPRIVARVLPLRERAVEEAVRRSLVDVLLVSDLGRGELALELTGLLGGGRLVGAGDQDQQGMNGSLRLGRP
jgi:hypothetical protein